MRIDYVHFYVKDALASQDWFVQQMGFQSVASGATRHTATAVVKSGVIYFVLSSGITSNSPVAQFLAQHPQGVADIAFKVSHLKSVLKKLLKLGVKVLQPLQTYQDKWGYLKWVKIAAWGDITHTLLERRRLHSIPYLPVQVDWLESTLKPLPIPIPPSSIVPFTHIDHIVLNVAAGDLPKAVEWYQHLLDFQPQQIFTIQTQRSGLYSQVMVHPGTGIQLPINEPTSPNSQIQEFLDLNRGPGIQHIALATRNILDAIAQRRRQGLSFINVPPSYYSQLRERYQGDTLSPIEWARIQQEQILVDWQPQSPQALLLQTFTQPIFPEPTFFFEFIERRWSAKGFGEGNFRALFEALEHEQLKRNL